MTLGSSATNAEYTLAADKGVADEGLSVACWRYSYISRVPYLSSRIRASLTRACQWPYTRNTRQFSGLAALKQALISDALPAPNVRICPYLFIVLFGGKRIQRPRHVLVGCCGP